MRKLRDLTIQPDFAIGQLFVSPARRLVRGPAEAANLQPLAMQAFLLLLEAEGGVVARDQLFDECWGGVPVGDDSLNRVIASVRRTLEQVAPGQFHLETIPRTGYRLSRSADVDVPEAPSAIEAGAVRQPWLNRRTAIAAGIATAAAGAGLWSLLPPKRSSDADRLFEQAHQILRHEYSERQLAAVPLLERALELEPGDTKALGLLAYARAVAATGGTSGPHDMQAAERSLKAALEADAKDPHARLALLLFQRAAFEWAEREDELRAIMNDDPDNLLALSLLAALYQASGRLKLSWDLNERLIALDPVSPSPQYRRALKHWIAGYNREADRIIDSVVQTWPRHPWVWNARFLIFAFTGRPHAALDMIENTAARPPNITPARMAQWRPTLIALEQPSAANVAMAREANLRAARESPGQAAYGIMALAGIGELDAAYQVAEGFLLSKGPIVIRRPSDPANMLVNNPSWRKTQWLSTPPMLEFRKDARFAALCEGIGLVDYWLKRGIRPEYPNVRMA